MSIKSVLVLSSVVLTSLAFGADKAPPSIKVTSFQEVGYRTRAAELCAKVEGVTTYPAFVLIHVDKNYKSPAFYNTVVGPEGKFCTVVATYTGNAEVSLWGSEVKVEAKTKRTK